jgi:hypothetical protein
VDDKREMGGGVDANHSLRKRWDGDISAIYSAKSLYHKLFSMARRWIHEVAARLLTEESMR